MLFPMQHWQQSLQLMTSSERSRCVRKIKAISGTKTDWSVSTAAKSEIDNRADTCCAGRNFRPLEFTGMTSSVSPFHEGYMAMQDILIATCASAVDLTNGTTVILIVNKALYFGESMEHSLINPNQIRVTGILVNDDSFKTKCNLLALIIRKYLFHLQLKGQRYTFH
jgi:hypothetical protein